MSAKKELKNIVCNQFNAKNSKKSILSKLFKLQYQFELKIVKRIVKKIKEHKMSKLKTNSEGKELCQDCGNVLPPPTLEDKGEGYSESVTYCSCGAIYTD